MQNAAYYIFFSTPKCFALVKGYSAEKIFHRGDITQKRLRTTVVENLKKSIIITEPTKNNIPNNLYFQIFFF